MGSGSTVRHRSSSATSVCSSASSILLHCRVAKCPTPPPRYCIKRSRSENLGVMLDTVQGKNLRLTLQHSIQGTPLLNEGLEPPLIAQSTAPSYGWRRSPESNSPYI